MKKLRVIFLVAIILFASSFVGIANNFDRGEHLSPRLALGLTHEVKDAPKNLVSTVELENLTATTQDESYSLLDDISIGVKNQLSYDICFTCATLTMLETYLIKTYQESYEFSPLHFATFKYIRYGASYSGTSAGGTIYDFMEYVSTTSGPVLEAEMPLKDGLAGKEAQQKIYYESTDFSKIVTVNKLANFIDEQNLSTSNKATNRNAMKSHIKQYGSLIVSIDVADGNNNSNLREDSSGKLYLKKATSTSDHMVNIIGWDDNYQVAGYSNKGAWLCQNSWGDFSTYFYVAYDDETVTDSVYGITEATLNTPTNIYSNSSLDGWRYSSIAFPSKTNLVSTFSIFDISSLKNNYINTIYLPMTATKNENSSISIAFTDSPAFSSSQFKVSTLDFSTTLKPIDNFASSTGNSNSYGVNTLEFNSNLLVTKNYMVIRYNIYDVFSFNGLIYSGSTYNSTPLLNTYSGTTADGYSNMYGVYNSNGQETSMLVNMRLKYSPSATEKNKISNFSTYNEYKENNQIKKNITYLGNSLLFDVENASETISLDKISILTTKRNSNSLSKTSVKDKFLITITNTSGNDYNIKIEPSDHISDTSSIYLVALNLSGTSYYKAFNISDKVSSYKINYNLNNGTNNPQNPLVYIHDSSSIKIYNPTRAGYTFTGWENITNATPIDTTSEYIELSLNNLEISLEATWELNAPTAKVAPTINADNEIIFEYSGKPNQITVNASHDISRENALAYQWYYSNDDGETYNLYPSSNGGNTKSVSLTNVDQSYYLYCVVSITVDGVQKTTETEKFHAIIQPKLCEIYWGNLADTSWNSENKSFAYDGKSHQLVLIGAEKYDSLFVDGYSQNKFTNQGDYTATATINLTSKNYTLPEGIETFNWKITKAPITIRINNISLSSKTDFDNFDAYTYTIEGRVYNNHDFDCKFKLEETGNESLKTIKLLSINNPNDNYDVQVIVGNLRLVNYELNTKCNDYEITLKNENGYILGTTLTSKSVDKNELSESYQKFFDDKRMTIYDVIDLSINDKTASEISTISLKLKSTLKDKNVKVYFLGDNGAELISSKNLNNVLTFNTSKLGQFVIVEAPEDVELGSMIIGLSVVLIAGLFCCVFISIIRNRRNKKYLTKSYNAH